MRKKSFVSAFLIIGLLIFCVRLGRLAAHEETLPSGAIKTAPPPPVLADAAARTAAASIVNKSRKRLPAIVRHGFSTSVAGSISAPLGRAMLEIEVDHKFADAHMSIWVDDLLTYTHPLAGIEKKRLVVFRRVQGHEFHAVQIPSGKHTLRVQVTSGPGLSEQSGTIDGEFDSGKEKMLRILFDKSGEMNLSLL